MKYGEARERLEEILAELESNEVDVDDLSERVKEAAALIRLLHDKLTKTRSEVQKVVADVAQSGAALVAEDTDEDGDDDASEPD